MRNRGVVAWVAVLVWCGATVVSSRAAEPQQQGDVLATLRPGHPRLIVLNDDLARARELIQTDPTARHWHDLLVAEAKRELKTKPVERVLIGPRLLDKSRTALNRISLLAGLYRLDGDRRYADRAVQEMLAVCAFADWNPKHFLDVAEMTTAVGIGYDWLFDVLTPEQRFTVRQAIVEKGLKPALPIYRGHKWWSAVSHNWNQVCNGGMTVGALAIADEERDLSREIINSARASIPKALRSYGPDGGWAEGPGYWAYATTYTAYYFSALSTALGTDFGQLATPGLADAGSFRIQSIGPDDLSFNYADAHANSARVAAMFWLARTFDRPAYAVHERSIGGDKLNGILDLFWYTPMGTSLPAAGVPTNAFFRGVNVAFFRSAWIDPAALYVGFKGGDNRANHAHLDLGTFVLDALGQRFAEDLGPDDYNIPGYFGAERWTYYRLKTEGHNTLTINGENQDVDAAAPIVSFEGAGPRPFAVADVSAAYRKTLKSWRRGIRMTDGKRVLVQDELEAKSGAVDVTWNLHTQATVTVEGDGASAVLTMKGQTMRARVLSPVGAKFDVAAIQLDEPQKPVEGDVNLVLRVGRVTSATVAVELTADETPGADVVPLDKWGK